MQFRMKQLLAKGQPVNVNEQLDVTELFRRHPDVVSTGPIHIDLMVQPEGGIVVVEGKLEIDMELACSRCLESTHVHSSIPFAEQFKPVESKKEDEAEDEDDDLIEIADDHLNLQPFIEEYVQLFMPFAPLCKADCQGLCQQCGSNLNEQSCKCSNERIDPRLESLKDFFKE
jgi:uncharacterized protein